MKQKCESAWIVFLGAILGFLLPVSVRAAETEALPLRIVLVELNTCCAASAWPEGEDRIARELALNGLQVVPISGEPEDDLHWEKALSDALNGNGADGALLLQVFKDGRALLHTLFRQEQTGATEYGQRQLSHRYPEDGAELIGIKAYEVVRAAVYETGPQASLVTTVSTVNSDPPPAPVPRPRQRPTPVPTQNISRSQWMQLRTAFGVSWMPGGTGAMGVAGGGVLFRLGTFTTLGVDGWVSVLSKDIETDAAYASVHLSVVRVRAAWVFSKRGPVLPSIGARVGMGRLRSKGASDSHTVADTGVNLFCASLFGEAEIFLTRRISMPVSVGVGILAPGVQIRFANETRATLDLFLLESTIGIAFIL